jgi:hypothetical protein
MWNRKCQDFWHFFPSLRHIEICNITANILTEVCSNVSVKPALQPLSGEVLSYQTASTDDDARVDIAATDFWTPHQKCYVDVRVFNPFLHPTLRHQLRWAGHKRNKQEREDVMRRESFGLNMVHSLLQCLLLLEVCRVHQLLYSINRWLHHY